MGHIQVIDEKNFSSAVQQGTVLVDFYADWCGPCRMLTPILEQLAQEMAGQVKVIKIDVDQSQMIAAQHDITSIPTLILFVDGQVKGKIVGLKNLQDLKNFVSAK